MQQWSLVTFGILAEFEFATENLGAPIPMTRLQRRQFLAGTLAAATVTGLVNPTPGRTADRKKTPEFYELRIYRCAGPKKQKLTSEYLEKAFIPALNRSRATQVGAFTAPDDEADNSIYVLIAYPSLELIGERNLTLADDEQFQKAAAEYFAQPKNMPPYKRIENRLMRAFDGMPAIELPASSKTGGPRIFELRIYESHNEHKAALKVDMFNSGEIDIMRDVNLGPVFFGETLVSNDMPNLTYMLSAGSQQEHEEHWDAFRKHPEWLRMKQLSKYKDTVSKITSVMLKPTAYSRI